MTLLTQIQSACRRIGLPIPTVVATSTDATAAQLFELAQEEGVDLAKYGDWRVLRAGWTFTSVAAETQVAAIATDLGAWLDETFWNRDTKRMVIGPVTPQVWAQWKAMTTFPVMDACYLQGTNLLLQPVPTAGQTYAYEYRSSHWCQSAGGTGQAAWAADTDVGRLSERLMALGLIWRYKQARGLAWEDDFSAYDFQVRQALAQDSPRSTVSMARGTDRSRGWQPGVAIPDGWWPV